MNSYEKERKQRSQKFIKYKNFFSSKPITLNEFEKNIEKYFDIYSRFWTWRQNFKYPELTYLRYLKKINPKPPENLIKDLAKSISELKNLYLGLKDFRVLIIFKLFFYYIAQCLKAEFGVKYYRQSYFRDTTVDLDIQSIITCIVRYFLNIKNKEKATKPWNNESADFITADINPLNHLREPSEYNRHNKELRKLLLLKTKNKILTIKHPISRENYKVTPHEMIVDNFFRLNLHNVKEEIELIIFNKKNKINKGLEKRLIISEDKNYIEYYWGEIKNNLPNGKGVSEKYYTDEITKKVHKKLGEKWWLRYSKNLKAKHLKGYILLETYEGSWKNGKKNEKDKIRTYRDPAYGSNKDWTPMIEII